MICDKCGKELIMTYRIYLKRISKHNGKYFCKECFNSNKEELSKKANQTRETCLKKYGVSNPAKLESSKEKAKNTCKEKYGTENFMQVPEIVEKIRKTRQIIMTNVLNWIQLLIWRTKERKERIHL